MKGIGVIGAGGFGLFALQHFMQRDDLKLIGISGTHREAAEATAKRFGAKKFESIEEMLQQDGLDIVYIATPPFLHYEQSMMALKAGKHVICEKPLAMTPDEGREMVAYAKEKGLLMVTNLMQKYNPLYYKIKTLIDQKYLGEVIHGFFENYASDEGLGPDHWFWESDKSGGIFVEHGVHFFDMFEGWIGKGNVECAQSGKRPGSGIEEQVNCTVRYADDKLVNFYHGFHQVGRMDRQEIRLLFERGDISLYEWIPSRVKINAVANESDLKGIMDLFPGARLDITSVYGGKDRQAKARHKDLDIYETVQIHYGDESVKMHIYGDLLRYMIEDQIKYLDDKTHQRKITEENGLNSLITAYDAKMKSLKH